MCMHLTDCPEHLGCAWVQIGPQENLNGIARRLNTSPLRLLELNPFIDPAELVEGMLILVPLPRFAHAHYGQTLESLLGGNAPEKAVFEALNPHLRGCVLLPGQRLRLS